MTHYVAMSGIGRDAAPAGGRCRQRLHGLRPPDLVGDDQGRDLQHDRPDGDAVRPRAVGPRRRRRPCAGSTPPTCRYSATDGRSAAAREWQRRRMADGSVRFIRSSIEPKKLAAAITIAGGEPGRPGLSTAVRHRILTTVLRWLAVVLILRVLVTILANYPDYFPPNFDSLFLQGREATFTGIYRRRSTCTSFPARSCCSTG